MERPGVSGTPCAPSGSPSFVSPVTRKLSTSPDPRVHHANIEGDARRDAMLKTARERVEKLFNEGKSEADVIAARPLKDLDAKWAASDDAAVAFIKMVYNSFKRS